MLQLVAINIMQARRFILILMGGILNSFGFGQAPTDTLPGKSAKWEVAIDLLGFTDENNVPKASLLFKRNYAYRLNRCKAWRFRLGTDTDRQDAKTWDGTPTGDYITYAPYLSVGHEWKKIFQKYRWFVGTDIFGSFTHSNQRHLVGADLYYDDEIRDYYFGLTGFTGFQANIIRGLSVSLESAFIIKYERKYLYSVGPLTWGGDNSRRLNTLVEPIMVVNFIYSLQNLNKNAKK